MNEIEAKNPPPKLAASPKVIKQFPLIPIIGKSLLATIMLVGLIVGVTSLTTGVNFWRHLHSADNVSESQRQARAQEFATMSAINLLQVSDRDIATAIEGMQLSQSAKQALMANMARSATAPANIPTPHVTAQPKAVIQTQQHEVVPARLAPIRLAWITLWDTDVEDGDVVRIDSQGYSRTVTLTTKPLTFAIPIPADGVVKVTGVLDGEGGGITVGLASGTSKAVFPVMSVGQELGLKVKVE